jgi:hypothetical protein
MPVFYYSILLNVVIVYYLRSTVIRFVSTSDKFGICTTVGIMGLLVEDKMHTFYAVVVLAYAVVVLAYAVVVLAYAVVVLAYAVKVVLAYAVKFVVLAYAVKKYSHVELYFVHSSQ